MVDRNIILLFAPSISFSLLVFVTCPKWVIHMCHEWVLQIWDSIHIDDMTRFNVYAPSIWFSLLCSWRVCSWRVQKRVMNMIDMTHMRDVTRSCWRETQFSSWSCHNRVIHTIDMTHMRNVTRSCWWRTPLSSSWCVTNESFICKTWLICVTWLVHVGQEHHFLLRDLYFFQLAAWVTCLTWVIWVLWVMSHVWLAHASEEHHFLI